jgi:predicted DNA-binding protein YlxM (UPF0122 family)
MSIKTYHIRNGNINGKTDVTIAEMADAWGLSKNTLYSRLNRGMFDVEKLSRKLDGRGGGKQLSQDPIIKKQLNLEERIKQRNFYEPLSRLLLKTI